MFYILYEEEPPAETPEAVEGGNPPVEETADTSEGAEAGASGNLSQEGQEENNINYEVVDYSEHFQNLEIIGLANCLSICFLSLIIILWKVFRTS